MLIIIIQLLFTWSHLSAQPTHMVELFMKENSIPGIFIAVVRGDSVLYKQGFGVADREKGTLMTDRTCMELGSISKAFTAEVIYQLQDAGHLNIKDPVSEYLPDAPASWSPIRIEHLLQHTSGIKNYLLDPRFMAADFFTNTKEPSAEAFFDTISTDDMLRMFYILPLEFPPGFTWSYSNTGYYLLGKICERVTGQPFFELAKELVLKPLGMSTTTANEDAAEEGCLASGYFLADSVFTTAAVLTSRYAFSAGAWAIDGQDMIRFMKAIHGRQLPSDRAGIEWRDQPFDNNLPFTYSDGHFYSTFGETNIISHNGGTPGFSSSWIYAVELNTSIIVMLNRQDYAPVDQLAWEILAWFEPSLKYPDQIQSEKKAEYYANLVSDVIKSLETGNPFPPGLSKPLQFFLESENGRGIWSWYFYKGYPDFINCVGIEKTGKETLYRFRLPHQQIEYMLSVLVNQEGELTQIRWW